VVAAVSSAIHQQSAVPDVMSDGGGGVSVVARTVEIGEVTLDCCTTVDVLLLLYGMSLAGIKLLSQSWWIPILWTTHYSLLKTCKNISIGGRHGCMHSTVQRLGLNPRSQSQVQRPNHNMYLAAPCIITFLYYILLYYLLLVCHMIQGWLEEQKQYCENCSCSVLLSVLLHPRQA